MQDTRSIIFIFTSLEDLLYFHDNCKGFKDFSRAAPELKWHSYQKNRTSRNSFEHICVRFGADGIFKSYGEANNYTYDTDVDRILKGDVELNHEYRYYKIVHFQKPKPKPKPILIEDTIIF